MHANEAPPLTDAELEALASCDAKPDRLRAFGASLSDDAMRHVMQGFAKRRHPTFPWVTLMTKVPGDAPYDTVVALGD